MTNTTFKNTEYLMDGEDFDSTTTVATFKVTELEERVVIEEDGDCLWAVVTPKAMTSTRRTGRR